jgi:hypothetical protein
MEQGRAVLVSAGVNETSQERQTGHHREGLVTSWRVEKLASKADWNHEGIVTVAEMFRLVADRVREETQSAQVPRYEIADGTIPLAVAP